MQNAIQETNFPGLVIYRRGKVRDVYDMDKALLMVSTDRISAFDVVMPNPIPDKGKILNQISLFWFEKLQPIVQNHVITGNVEAFPKECQPYKETLRDRSMFVKKTNPIPIECVVRGYLSGSGWKSYQKNQEVCGIALPKGLVESQKLPKPIFTPSTKEEVGTHDINISFEETAKRIGQPLAEKIRDISLALYIAGSNWAEQKGIIIADTKFEFGLDGQNIYLIDEVFTPDSSRFWPKETYKPGGPQNSFDKQYLRDYLLSINWNQKPPAPSLPNDVIVNTRNKYVEALNKLADKKI